MKKTGRCHSCICKYVKGHSSNTCQNPKEDHQKEATRRDTKNGSSRNKNFNCSHYEEHGFWVPDEKK